jgi:hypothetical protein
MKVLKSVKPEFDSAVLKSIENLVIDESLLALIYNKYEKVQIPIRFMVK